MADIPSQPPVELRGSWGRLVLPQALIIALLTTVASIGASRCGATTDNGAVQRLEQVQRQNHDAITLKIDSVQQAQTAILDRMNKIETQQSLEAIRRDLDAAKQR